MEKTSRQTWFPGSTELEKRKSHEFDLISHRTFRQVRANPTKSQLKNKNIQPPLPISPANFIPPYPLFFRLPPLKFPICVYPRPSAVKKFVLIRVIRVKSPLCQVPSYSTLFGKGWLFSRSRNYQTNPFRIMMRYYQSATYTSSVPNRMKKRTHLEWRIPRRQTIFAKMPSPPEHLTASSVSSK